MNNLLLSGATHDSSSFLLELVFYSLIMDCMYGGGGVNLSRLLKKVNIKLLKAKVPLNWVGVC